MPRVFRLLLIGLATHASTLSARQLSLAPDTLHARFAGITDSVARIAGMPLLSTLRAPSMRYQELRVAVGFGLFSPDWLLRLRLSPGGVSGDLWAFWDPDDAAPATASEAETDWLRRNGPVGAKRMAAFMRRWRRCGPVRYAGGVAACRVDLPATADWGAVANAVNAIDPWTLVDERVVHPHAGLGLDGTTVQVESLNLGRYRTYAWWEPAQQEGPEARRAAALGRLVDSLVPQ